MATFPRLRTGAITQYPTSREMTFATDVLRFLDGEEQRYRERAAGGVRWLIKLDQLDEAEIAAIQEFFIAMAGRSGRFEFQDPWSGRVYPDCSFDADELEVSYEGEAGAKVDLVVKENRS